MKARYSITLGLSVILRLKATRDGDMGEGFGVGLQFQLTDDDTANNSAGVVGAMRESASDDDTALFFRTRSAADGTVEHMRITSQGKVGIGTNAPVEKLHVTGAVVVGSSEASTAAAGTIRWTGSDFEGYTGSEWVSLTFQGAVPPAGMAYIPPGSFMMGDNYGEGDPDELPVHTVYVSGFYMDKFEVTNQQMANVLQWAYDQIPPLVGVDAGETTVTNTQGISMELLDIDSYQCYVRFTNGVFYAYSGKEKIPCGEVTWYGAQAYCNYRSDQAGQERCIDFSDWSCDFSKDGYRLPTEAEWEKAARGGLSGHHYPWESYGGGYADHINGTKANYYESGDLYEDYGHQTPIGYYDGEQVITGCTGCETNDMANGYGLYDMSGNEYEWCWDWYQSDWYSQPVAVDPDTTGPGTPLTERVARGGSLWVSTPALRCAERSNYTPDSSTRSRGFRAARGL